MESKIIENYVDHGFGFPVAIPNVTVNKIHDEWVPLINYGALEKELIEALPSKPSSLTGSEVRFIRLHFVMSLSDFARHLGVSHVAVRKWEANRDKRAGMQWPTEKNLRLFVLRKLDKPPKHFVALFDELEQKRSARPQPFHLDIRMPGVPAPARRRVAVGASHAT